MRDRWGDGVWSALLETRERLAAILPGLFVLVVLLALGVLLGFVAKVVLERGARALGFDRVMERWGVAASLRRSGTQRGCSRAPRTGRSSSSPSPPRSPISVSARRWCWWRSGSRSADWSWRSRWPSGWAAARSPLTSSRVACGASRRRLRKNA